MKTGKKCNEITARHVCDDGYKLGVKIKHIRDGSLKLTLAEIEILKNLGFLFDFKRKYRFDFESFYQHLTKQLILVNNDWKEIKDKTVCEDGYALGSRIASIRSGVVKLNEEQIKKLNEIGFIWRIRATKFMFEFEDFFKRITELLKQHNGNWKKINTATVCNDGYPMGDKIHNLRGGNIKLTQEQIKRLDEIGFLWSNRNEAFKFNFVDFVSRLKAALEKEHGDWLELKRYYKCEDDYPLGQKIGAIRTGLIKLTPEQKNTLEDMGFLWKITTKFNFEKFFRHAEEMLAKNNGDWSKLTQRSVCEDGYTLGMRILAIRQGSLPLTEEQRKRLEELGFKWKVRNIKFKFVFEDFVSRLIKEYEKCGKNWQNLTQATKCDDGYPIGEKISSIRAGNIKLNQQQVQKLNELGFAWRVRNLARYREENQQIL